MRMKWILGLLVAAVLTVPAIGLAHEGHAHKVMGTVSSIDGKNIMVKTADGKSVMVMLDDKTKLTQGKAKVELSALKVGDRIVAEGAEEKGMVTAATIQIGAAKAAPAAAKKDAAHPHTDAH